MVNLMRRSGKKDAGVSPVVGVMLMLVVTIIIAGIISLTAAGFMDSTSTQTDEPQIEFVGLYTAGYTAATSPLIPKYSDSPPTALGGLLFKVVGNKPVDLTKMKIYLASGATSGGGGSVSLGYDDPVSKSYLYGTGGSKLGAKLFPPDFMDGHRIVLFGLDKDDPNIFNPIAEPGDMFIVVCEYLDPASTFNLHIGLKKDDADGNGVISAGIGANGDSLLTLVNAKTGYVYLKHMLTESDMIATV